MEDPAYLNRASGQNPYTPVINETLSLFSIPEIEVASQSVYTTEYNPSVPIVNGQTNSITFNLGSSVDFTLLARISLYMEVYITKADGTPMPPFTATESAG